MACPHVSGVAALVVSQFGVGKRGFTNEDLWDILKNAVLNVDINDRTGYNGMLGAGYISAYNALNGYSKIPPAAPEDLWAAWHYDNVDLTWSVTFRNNGQESSSYEILISDADLTGADFNNPPAGARKVTVQRDNVTPYEGIITHNIDGLDPGTVYYVSIKAVDRFGNRSTAVMRNGTTTTAKTPEAITDLAAIWWLEDVALTWSVTGDSDNVKAISYDILISQRALTDQDFEDLPQDVTKKSVEVGSKNIGDELTVSFDGLAMNTKYYVAVVGLNSADARSPIALTDGSTIDDLDPEVEKYLEEGHRITIDMSAYFTDDLDAGNMTYDILVEPNSIIDIDEDEIDGNKFAFISKEYGQAKITVTAYDSRGHSIKDDFLMMCRDDSRPMDLYPNPAREYMYVRLGKSVMGENIKASKGRAYVAIYNSAGQRVLSEQVSISLVEPGKVDVSKLSPGSHSVTVTYNNKETKGTITKY